MKFISNILGYVAKAAIAGVVGFVGLFVVLALVVTLFTGGNLGKGLGASLTMTRYTVIFIAGSASYLDNLIPDAKYGKALGDKALGDTPKA